MAHDDVLIRFAITQLLSKEGDITVVGSAPFDEDLVRLIKASPANIVVLDAILNNELPLSRFRALNELHLPIIALTDSDEAVARHIIPLIEAGAVGFVTMPSKGDKLSLIHNQLVHEVRLHTKRVPSGNTLQGKHLPDVVVAIGSSTGGPEALAQILPQFPANFPAGIVIVQHMPGMYTKRFSERLARHCNLAVKEAQNGDRVEEGTILLAKGDYHLVFDAVMEEGVTYAQARLTLDPPQWKLRPTVDKMMSSLAPIFGSSMIGVILTGMGQDGVVGMREIKQRGGQTCVQNRESSVVYGMAQEVVKHDLADKVLPLNQIVPEVMRMVEAL